MAEPFLAEIRIMSFSFPPKGWAACNGQLLPINQNQALFSLLGTTYGGDGRVTFALPDLRGRVPVHVGDGVVLGERAGEESHTLVASEMPAHNHVANAYSANGNTPIAVNDILAAEASAMYTSPANLVSLAADSISSAGGSQTHNNLQPFLTLNFCIALVGIYPSRN